MSGRILFGSQVVSQNLAKNYQIVVNNNTSVFLAPMIINVRVYSLRPRTRVYTYFDNTPISNLCTPCNNSITDSFSPTAVEGSNLVTDSDGKLSFSIRVPKNTFQCKTSFIRVLDVTDLTQIANTTTGAIATFFGDSKVSYEVESNGTKLLSTPTELNIVKDSEIPTIIGDTPTSLQTGTDPYYFNLAKVNNIKPNSATVLLGGFEIDEQ